MKIAAFLGCLILVPQLFSVTAKASDNTKNLKAASQFVSELQTRADVVSELASAGDRTGACIALRRATAVSFGFTAETYQLNAWSWQKLPMDVHTQEDNFSCRIQILQSFCLDVYGWVDEAKDRLVRPGACVETYGIQLPATLDGFNQQAKWLSQEAARVQTLLSR